MAISRLLRPAYKGRISRGCEIMSKKTNCDETCMRASAWVITYRKSHRDRQPVFGTQKPISGI